MALFSPRGLPSHLVQPFPLNLHLPGPQVFLLPMPVRVSKSSTRSKVIPALFIEESILPMKGPLLATPPHKRSRFSMPRPVCNPGPALRVRWEGCRVLFVDHCVDTVEEIHKYETVFVNKSYLN